MGIFDFIKDAGKKLTGREVPEEAPARAARPAKAASPGVAAPSMAELRKKQDQARGTALAVELSRLKLGVEGLNVKVDGDTATVSGKAPDQATREKVVLAIGNTAGIARVDDRMTVSKAEPQAQFYTVKSGDTLSKIAKQFYGNPMKYPVIFEANKPMLTDPDKIYPGQVLRIPAQG
jgi:LysM repeat protein